MPQQICQKCSKQLKTSYKFIQQACKITQLYLKQIDEPDIPEDIKDIEQLQETLIEIKPAAGNQQLEDKIKVEPLSIECNVEIKEEQEQEPVEENEIYIPIIENKEDSLEERY